MFLFRAINEKIKITKLVKMRIIGLDPGLRNLGWGVIELDGSRQRHIANGVCHSKNGDLASRLALLFEQLQAIIAQYKPDEAAVEKVFVNTDAVATLKLGQARAICLLAPTLAGLSVSEYAPNTVKKLVVGQGHAQKTQVQFMLGLQLPGIELAGADAADALAVALAHAQHAGSTKRLNAAIEHTGVVL